MEAAWREFGSALTDRIAASSGLLVLDLATDTPNCTIHIDRRDGRLTFRMTGVGTHYEPPWVDDGLGAVLAVADSSSVEELVASLVTVVRSNWGLPHPAFLIEPPPLPTCVQPTSVVHLSRLTESALAAQCPTLSRQDDVTVSVQIGRTTVMVYAPDTSEVRIHATLVDQLSGRTRAAELLADLNRRWPSVECLLVEDRIHAAATVPARPFVAEHLHQVFAKFAAFVATVDDNFAANFGGRLCDVPDAPFIDHDDLPPQLTTLLEMEADGVLTADAVLRICDRETAGRYARFCAGQSSEWREHALAARASGDRVGAEECEKEAIPWDCLLRALESALRIDLLPD